MTANDDLQAFLRGPINEAPWGRYVAVDRAAALHAPLAGIELGSYDERILAWLAEMGDNPTVLTIASLLHRARTAQPLPSTATEAEPRFDLITCWFTSEETGAGGGQQILRDLTAAELDAKLAEHGITRHEGDRGRVTLAQPRGLQLLWQPAGTDPIQ